MEHERFLGARLFIIIAVQSESERCPLTAVVVDVVDVSFGVGACSSDYYWVTLAAAAGHL
eukprot:2403600-Pyramimonas_sp.AAC.1